MFLYELENDLFSLIDVVGGVVFKKFEIELQKDLSLPLYFHHLYEILKLLFTDVLR